MTGGNPLSSADPVQPVELDAGMCFASVRNSLAGTIGLITTEPEVRQAKRIMHALI